MLLIFAGAGAVILSGPDSIIFVGEGSSFASGRGDGATRASGRSGISFSATGSVGRMTRAGGRSEAATIATEES